MLTFDFSNIDLHSGAKILDVGCGEGRHIFGSLQAFQQAYCIGYDQHIPSLNICKDGLDFFQELDLGATIFIQGSVYKLPFEDNSFDLIFCSEVLEHLHEYRDAITEINRVLKPGGKFLASVPAEFPERICWALSKEYQNQPGGHLRIFKKKNLIHDVSERGFKFIQSERFHSVHSAYWWLRCFFWKSQETNILIRWYKKFLEIHILQKPKWIDLLDRSLNPILGKSIALYFEKK